MGEGKIEYYTIDGVPGRFFACPSGVGKFSEKACAGFYNEAMSPQGMREGLRFSCRGCEHGARHAGVEPIKAASRSFRGRLSCARCLRLSPRLIRGKICVSCYNREREAIIGRNAKGNRPVRARRIEPAVVTCNADQTVSVHRIDRASSQVEAVLSIMRDNGGQMHFDRTLPPIQKRGGHAAAGAVR